MYIRAVSEKYNIPMTTIRYYIDSGILNPNKVNTHYVFSEVDLWELEIIINLKKLEFSIEEILQFMKVVRTYNLDDENICDHLLTLYKNKHQILIKEKERIIYALNTLTGEIGKFENISNQTNRTYGVPSFFLSKFRCRNCNNYFDISDMQVHKDQIMSAVLKCACGYSAIISEGIFIAPANEFYKSEYFNMTHFSEIPTNDHDFIFFQYMNKLSEQYLAMLSKAYAWIDLRLQKMNMDQKIIFVPDLSAHFFYKYAHKPYWQNSYIIISGYSTRSLKSIKKHLESLDLDLKILFIANTIHELPIQNNSIDIWIDSIASYNFSFFHKDHSLHEYLIPHLHSKSEVVGITKYFSPRSISHKNIERIFKLVYPDNSLYETFEKNLTKNDFRLLQSDELGYVINPGSYYSYVEKDEKHWFRGYHAKYKV